MEAVLLAGGRGRRLVPFTIVFPKPLAPIGDVPIIDIILHQLRNHGIKKVHISVGYLSALIEAYLATRGGVAGLSIAYIRESTPLGTAGPAQMLAHQAQPVLVLNGDLLTTFDFRRFIAFYEEERPAIAIAVQRRRTSVDFGVIETSATGEVTGYLEKPSLEHLCSMGINIYSPEALAAMDPGETLDFPALVDRMLGQGGRVLVFEHDGYWMDIGRREDYERAIDDWPSLRASLMGESEAGSP